MKRSKGVTLIELIVTIGLLMIVLFSLTMILKPMTQIYFTDATTKQVSEIRDYIISQVKKELRGVKSLQIYGIDDSKEERSLSSLTELCDENKTCFYVDYPSGKENESIIQVIRNGELNALYEKEFYDRFCVDWYFLMESNGTTLIYEIEIYDKNNHLLDVTKSSVELINIDNNKTYIESSRRQFIVCE